MEQTSSEAVGEARRFRARPSSEAVGGARRFGVRQISHVRKFDDSHGPRQREQT